MADLVSTAASLSNPVGLGLAGGQALLGVIQSIGAQGKINRLMGQRKAFQTPQGVYDIVSMAQQASQSGYDPVTMDYLTNQTDRAYADAAGDINRLGGDPNDIANLFDRRIQAGMKIGAENHNLNMQHFSNLVSAKEMLVKNQEAEFVSQQNLIKDQLQAAGADKAAGLQNIAGAANTALSVAAGSDARKLFPSPATTGVQGVLSAVSPTPSLPGTGGIGSADLQAVIKLLADKLNQPK